MTNADGTPVTVYVDKDFNVVSTDSGMPHAHRMTREPRPAADHNAAGSRRAERTNLRRCA